MNNPVNWFEIPVTDMERARKFYEKVFDLKVEVNEWEEGMVMGIFPFDHTTVGASGALIKNKNHTPSHQGTLVYFSVKEIEDIEPKIKKEGGKILNSKFSIGEHGSCAIFEDTEGNRVALHQNSE